MIALLFDECIRYVEGIAKECVSGCQTEPFVSIGGSTAMKPFEFIVRELPESVSFDDSSTSTVAMRRARACYRVDFSVACQAWAKKRGVDSASFAVMEWFERFCSAIASDRTLGGLVIHAEPYFSQGGTAYENDRALYLAGIDFGVRVKAQIDPIKTS